MKAIGFDAFGGPELLRIVERPVPEPAPDELVVRVEAAALNPTDLMMLTGLQAGMMKSLKPPFVGGMEFSGRISAAGASFVLPVGTRVFGVVNPRLPGGGAHSEYIKVPRASVAVLPDSTDPIEAATIPMNGLTALLALELTGLKAGQNILITGGTGILGGAAIRLASIAGLRVFAGGNPQDADLLQELGAEVVLPRQEGLVEAVRRRLPEGADGMIDGALIGNSVSAAVRDGGAAISARTSHPIEDARLRSTYVSVISGLERRDLLERLADLYVAGKLAPRIAENGVVHFTDAPAAYARAVAGGFRGRIVLTFGDK